MFNSTRGRQTARYRRQRLHEGGDRRPQAGDVAGGMNDEVHVPSFADAYMSSTGVQIGVRESRHIGRRLRAAGRTTSSRGAVSTTWSRAVSSRSTSTIPTGSKGYHAGGSTSIKPKGPYDIPLRCLVPQKGIEGLFLTGRGIAAVSREKHGSLRVQGTAFAIGHASGAAAAVTALGGPHVGARRRLSRGSGRADQAARRTSTSKGVALAQRGVIAY